MNPLPRNTYIHGCNYPWSTDGTTVFYGLDFGANVWGSHLGVSTRLADVRRDFDEMARLGFTATRWFVFADGRAGIVFDEGGLPVRLDAHLFIDLDAALAIAGAAGIGVVLVLLDHRWMFDGVRDTIADPATGVLFEAHLPQGRARVLQSPAGRDALFGRVIDPLIRRYGSAGERSDLGAAILGFELMNEPDFVIEEWEADLSARVRSPLPFAAMAELVTRLSDGVHAALPALTTMGCARLHNLWAWDSDRLGLDLLQVHTYPDTRLLRRNVDVFGMPATSLGVSRPVLLGEFPGNGPLQHPAGASPPPTTLDDYLEFAVSSGYAGAWPWSFSGTDAYGRLPEEALRRFGERHPQLVNPRFSTASSPT